MSDFDSPWKEALNRFLRAFLEFFFPDIAADIDWSRGYEALDKELEQIVREAEIGKRLADKLFKVWRQSGEETCVVIHVEVQGQADAEFPERMYVYNYRTFDRFRRPVASLAVLGDENRSWRPEQFTNEIWGCQSGLRFRARKLLDCAGGLKALENDPNPLALIVLAHLQSQATRDDAPSRCVWKVRLVRILLDRGMDAEDVRQLFRFIDWLLELPAELEEQFDQEIHAYAQEKQMTYISTLEKRAMEKGREAGRTEGAREGLLEGIELTLEAKFGADGKKLMPAVRLIQETEKLRSFQQMVVTAESLEDAQQAIGANQSSEQ